MITVSILGCGWLGLPLGAYLVNQGIAVKGSVTAADKLRALQKAGIKPFRILLAPSVVGNDTEDFFHADVLVITIPPERRADIEEYYPAQMQELVWHIQKYKIPKVLFISSTSVYPDYNRAVFESDDLTPSKPSGKALLAVEKLFQKEAGFKTTNLRFGGLVGYDRLPGRFLAAKKDLPNANAPVNLIHQDDCVEIIYQIIRQNAWGETFNACADKHPLRKDYYTEAAMLIGLEPPQFANNNDPVCFKLVNSEKLKQRLMYEFKYPDPIAMLSKQVVQ